MPTYEFRCPDGHEFEKFYRSIGGAESQAACPLCGKPAERMMSTAGFAFKGSGFYLTDYGKNAHRDKGIPEVKSGDTSANQSGGEAAKSDSGASETKSDAPAAASAKSAETSSSGGDSKKVEKKTETKSDSTPAAAPPKPSKDE